MRFVFAVFALFFALCGSALATTRVPMYYMYSAQFQDWFFTIDPNQRDLAIQYGYFNYGVAFYVESDGAEGGVPLRRFYNFDLTDHFYTADPSEAQYVLTHGWVEEQSEGYVRTTPTCNSSGMCNEVPMFRAYNVNPQTGDAMHFLTSDQNQYNAMVSYYGWWPDGIKGYVFAHAGLLNLAKVAVLAYHTGTMSPVTQGGTCDTYATMDLNALRTDLNNLDAAGFRVVPIQLILDWATGLRDGSDLPPKAVGITFDDGNNEDWNQINHPFCGAVPSARSVITEFLNTHAAAATQHAHYRDQGHYFATSFVIASKKVHKLINPNYWQIGLTTDWWASAKTDSNRLIDIQNHSTDHDHTSVANGPILEDETPGLGGVVLPVGGHVDSFWTGRGTFCRIGQASTDGSGRDTAVDDVVKAAESIYASLQAYAPPNSANFLTTPSIFAAPNTNMHPSLKTYFETHSVSQHHTQYAFAGMGSWVRRDPGQSKYAFRRFVKVFNWNQASDLLLIAQGHPSKDVPNDPNCTGLQ